MKEYRATPDGKHIYPWPIVKDQKHLISTPSPRAAAYLILLFKNSYLTSLENFEQTIHGDGATPIFHPPKNGPVALFLPNRNEDEGSAFAIEKVLSKRLWQYVTPGYQDDALKNEVIKRFDAQKDCSTCNSLGINHELVAQFITQVLSL